MTIIAKHSTGLAIPLSILNVSAALGIFAIIFKLSVVLENECIERPPELLMPVNKRDLDGFRAKVPIPVAPLEGHDEWEALCYYPPQLRTSVVRGVLPAE